MSFARLFVLWIAMIAVPFQGYAAASMAFCAAGHEESVSPSVAGPAVLAHDHSMHDDDGGSQADAVHQCGTCGACHATALTCFPTVLSAHALPPADLVEPSAAMATLASRVPDKPPRG